MRPHQLLPIRFPSEHEETPEYFYENIVKPLVPTFIKLMNQGINIDQEAVEELRTTVINVVDNVQKTLNANSIIQQFQKDQYPAKYKEYEAEMKSRRKELEHFTKAFKEDNIVHRTYVVNTYLGGHGFEKYKLDKWTVKELKQLLQIEPLGFIQKVIDKEIQSDHPAVTLGMKQLALDKMTIYNKSHCDDKLDSVTFEDLVPQFNAGSSLQKQKLFEYLKVPPLATSKDTGLASWGRDQVEEVFYSTEDEVLKEVLQAFIDYSFSNIIKTNFMEAFDKFVVDDKLHGNIKLFGAKTFRPTSNAPNMLNMPSTGSVYASPLKKCFIAPPGYVVWGIDLSALEDRVIANLSGDTNKLGVFTEGLDGHSLSATYYFPEEVKALIGDFTDNKEASIKLKALVDSGNKEAKAVRQRGKPVTFGLSYGSFPPKVADTIKCSIEEATSIFDAYHNEMYPEITAMRERSLKVAKEQGYLHLGLGCRIYADDIDKDSRTLFNSLSQFWSVITLIALDELYFAIEEAGMQDKVKPNATIYDAIYGIVEADPATIEWLNNKVVELMTVQIFQGEIVHNEAAMDIGLNWNDVTELPNNATQNHIKGVLDDIRR